MFVVIGTRTGSGRIAPPSTYVDTGSEPTDASATTPAQSSRIPAEDHAPLKARILLMLALNKTKDRSDIQRIFSEY